MRNPYEAKQYINTGIWKKLLAVLLTVTMLAETVPLSAFADETPLPEQTTPETVISETETAAGNNDNNVEETYIPEAQTEDIPEVIPVVYQVMFDLRGHGDAIEAVSVEENGRAVKPEDPAADGYAFEGWYTDAEYENRWDFDSMPVVHNTVLYAKWTEEMNEEYTDEVSDPEIGADTDAETEDVSGGAGSADDEEMQESAESIESSGEDYSEENSASETGSDNQPEETDDVSDGDGSEADEETKELTEEDAEEENNESEEDSGNNPETEKENERKEATQTDASTDEKRDANAEEVVAFKDTANFDTADIAVCATAGAFPDGAALSVGEVSAEKQADVEAAVEELREEGRRVAASYTFEIKVLDEDGATELEPADASTVKVFFAFAEAADPNLKASVYHVSADKETGELSAKALDVLPAEEVSVPDELGTDDPETVVTVETEGFSYYTVEFTYAEMQYVLEGDASIPLADILSAVGLSGDVEAVEVSDETLFAAAQENETWMITALSAFDSEEWMKVTIGGVTYEITVTDDGPAQAKKTINTATTYTFYNHVLTDRGALVASPASAAAGETVTLTLQAEEYYAIAEDGFTVLDGKGQEVSLAFTAQADGSYTFVMPDDADNDTYTVTAEIVWTDAPPSGNVTTQNIVIPSGIEHGKVFAKYLPYEGSSLYELINSVSDAGTMKTLYDTPRPVWLYAEPEAGYELAAWKVEAVYLDDLAGEPDGSLPVERLDGADPSGDELEYPWLFELGKYYRNSNKYICFRISADFREIQEPVPEAHSITLESQDVSGADEPITSSISAWLTVEGELVEATEAKKGDIVTIKVDLQPGTGLSMGPSGTDLTIYIPSAADSEYIEYTPVEGEENAYTFVMPDREVKVLARFDYLRFTVTPATLPTRSAVRYAFYRNGTDLDHLVGAGYFETDSDTWVKTEKSEIWEARPADTVALDINTYYMDRETVPGTLTLLDAETGEAVGEPLPLKVLNQSGTEYRAETTMPARDITFAVNMLPCYTVSVNESDYGQFGRFPQRAREGEKITIYATANDDRYDVLWDVTWTDEQGELHHVDFTKDPEDRLKASFIMPAADVQVSGEFSEWRGLQRLIDEAPNGGTVTLGASYTAFASDTHLVVSGKAVTIDLNGYTLDRALTQAKLQDGRVFYVTDGATLTIKDSSAKSGGAAADGETGNVGNTGTGLIRGGYAGTGGGIYITGGSTLNIEGGIIGANIARVGAGGIFVDEGTLNMTGGIVAANSTEGAGGGIYTSDKASVHIEGVIFVGNIAGTHGGALFLRLADDASIKDCIITENTATKNGGGLRLDAEGKTLTIENTEILSNRALDDGAGIHLNYGSIVMRGGKIADNMTKYDGGGVKLTSDTSFTASNVTISGNRANSEEGGGIKNHGTTTLDACIIEKNQAKLQGGGLFNDNNGNSQGTMTLRNCTVTGNISESDGGGVYSDKKLTIIGGEITGNTATHGGGVYIGSGSEDTGIQDAPVIRDNTATVSAQDLYLRSGRKLALNGPLTDDADIWLDLETGAGVLTKDYRAHNGTDDPEAFFTLAKGYGTAFTAEGEVEICSEWSALKKQIESIPDGSVITLSKDYAAASSDDRITVSKNITIDLNGHILNRNRLSKTDSGHVLEVFSGGTLTLLDSSEAKTGLITGGWSGTGGGVYVNGGGTLNLRGVRIAGNRADGYGGGVYLKGKLNLTDGVIEDNTATKSGGIRVESGAAVTVQGSPVVWGNTASGQESDLYLPSRHTIGIAGPLTDGTKIGVALGNDWGVITRGYEEQNPDEDPALFFASTEGHGVHRENGEAVLGPSTYGGTEYQDPFIHGGNQINDNTLGAQNWMSGLSGERLLNEINMPGSHDSGMNNVQDIQTSQGFTWLSLGIAAVTFALAVGPGTQAVAFNLALLSLGLSVGMPHDYTNGVSYFAEDMAAPKAKTQKEYIDQQLADGCRQLDLRLYHQHKVYKWYINGYKYEDDGENLWVCHGKKGGGRYLAQDSDDDELSFSQVLSWVKDFLRLHPTETIILDLRPETEDDKEKKKIYPRAREILEDVAMDINPSTGEPYLYKNPWSDDYFASYERMPKLADCRGRIVLMPDNEDFRHQVGGFVRGDLVNGQVLAELDYQNTMEQMVDQMESAYSTANRDGSVRLPSDATSLDRLWYWELNCTGQHAGDLTYYFDMDAPHKLAEYVNSHLIGDDKVLGEQRTGQYIGWVRMDSFNAKYAEDIWRTNFFDGLKYHTVTVKSGLEDQRRYPDQTYTILEGTRLTVPENIYKQLADGQYFAFWETDTGKRYNPGDIIQIDSDITLTAKWLGDGEIPVRILWKDGDNKDGLRPGSLALDISVAGTPAVVTLTEDGGWSGIITALAGMKDQIVITPAWSRIDTSGNSYGTDTDGQYRYELSYEAGTGFTLTLIHTPQGAVLAAGEVKWEDSDNAAGKRPETVMIRLYKNGEPTGGIAEVSAAYNWHYSFGSRKQYENGEENIYTVSEDEIGDYVTEISGFTVTNTYAPEDQGTINIEGLVQWDDAGNAKGLRPEKTLVRLQANGAEAGSQEVESTGLDLWYWTFDNVLYKDEAGSRIAYTVDPQQVEGYTVTCERIGLVEADGQDGSGSGAQGEASDTGAGEEEDVESYMFLITYTLEVADEEKTDAAVTREPQARELSYSATAQELIEEGEAEGGRLMYALGDSADTPPEASAFTAELPVGTDAGTYHVWYYVKADVMHRDSTPQHLAVNVDRAVPVIDVHDLRITDGDIGRTVEAAVTGVEGATEGLGALRYEVTEGDAVAVDASTGALTVQATGITKLKVSVPETTNYTAAEATVTVTVVHQHALTEIAEKAVTCEEDGNIDYWLCAEGDGRCFSDAEGIHEIAKDDTVIPALGHNWGEWEVTREATETEEGEETRVCHNDPTHVETRVIPMLTHVHSLTFVEAKAATCTEDGNIAYWGCSQGENPCGRYFSDETGTTEITKEEIVIAALGHDWGEWVVTQKATATEPGVKTRTCKHDPAHTETETISQLTFTAPAAVTRLVYDHEEKALVTAGTAEGGLLQYALGTDATTAPADDASWSTTLPTATDAGSYYVWYRVAGDDEHQGTEPVCIVVTVSQAAAEIRYAEQTVSKRFNEPPFNYQPTNSGDGTVTYSSSDESVATVDSATGGVIIVGAGEAVITATATDSRNYHYDPAVASYTLTVSPELESISFMRDAVEKTWGDEPFTNELTNTGDAAVTYTSGDVSVATVDAASGLVTLVGAGTATVTATVEDSAASAYEAPAVSYQLTVKQAENPGFVSGSATVTRGGNTLDLQDLVRNAQGQVSYAISSEALGCTVDADGVFTSGNTPGTVTVMVTFAGDNRYAEKTVELTVNVADKTTRRLSGSATRIYGDPLNLPIYIVDHIPEDAEPDTRYTGTLRSGVAYDSPQEPTQTGEYILTLNYEDSEEIWIETITFKIMPRQLGIPEITLGDALTYNGSEQTQTVASVMWGEDLVPSSDYTVTNNRGTDAGVYTLTVTATPTGNYTGSATKEFTISQAEGQISYPATSVSKLYGDEAFTNALTKSGDGSVTYASDNEAVAMVDPATGEVTIKGAGEATITATATDGRNYTYDPAIASYILNVSKKPAAIYYTGTIVTKNYGDEAFINELVNTGDATVTYMSESPSVAAVNPATGEATILGVGSTTVTATVGESANYQYNPSVATYALIVGKMPAAIGFEPDAVTRTYGDAPFTLKLTNTGDGTVSYTSSNTDVATVDATTGEVTVKAAGEATITATVADGATATYAVKTATCQLTVEKAANPAIIPAYVSVQTEDTVSLWAKINGPVGGLSFAIDGDANGCTVDPNTGAFTAGNTLGDVTVTVTVAGDQNHEGKTGTITVHVVGQSINSPELRPARITYGEGKLDEVIKGSLWSGATPSMHYTGTTRGGEPYNSDEAPEDAGEYLVTINYEYSGGLYEGVVMAWIEQKSLAGATVTLGKPLPLTYTGSEQTQQVAKVTWEVTVVTPNGPKTETIELDEKEYTVTNNQEADAGNYILTVTATPNGNYKDFVTKEFTIAQAKGELSYAEDVVEKTWGDDAFTNKLTNTGDGTVSYKSDNPDVAIVDPDGEVTIVGVGEATITAKAADGANYTYEPTAAEASYTLKVAKAAASVSAPPTPVQDLEYNGSQQSLVTPGTTDHGTMQYALGTDASTPPADSAFSKDIPTGKDAGTYYVWYKVVGDDRHSDSKVLTPVTVTVRKLETELVWSNTELTYNKTAQAPTATVKKLITGDSCDVTVEGAQTNAGTYTARATALSNGNYKLPENATADFTIQKAEGSISFAAATVEKTWGDESFTIKPTIVGDGTVTYESSNPNVATVDLNTGEVAIIGVGEATITATAVEGTNYTYDPASAKASYPLTVAPAEAEVFKAPATVMNLTYTGAPQPLVTAGEAIGGTMQYVLGADGKTPPADDAPWSTSLPTGTDAGIYYVWYRVLGDPNHNNTAPVSVTGYIAPVSASGSVQARTLHYTGEAQDLVEPVQEPDGGSLMYTLGSDALTPPDLPSDTSSDTWSDQIPKGTEVGTYYVWHYIKGDDNHTDTVPEVTTVTILKVVSYDVTFKVSHGSWDKGGADDIVVKLEGYEAPDSSTLQLKLSRADIPAVGNNPERYYDAGSWDVTPDTETEITQNTTYTYTYQKIAYVLTEGDGQTYTKGSAVSLRFVIKRAPDDGPAYSHFTAVNCGTAVLARDQDYTAASGSLVLTLQPAFLETLNPGRHTVNVWFDDVAVTDPVPVTFTVRAPAVYTVTFNSNGHGTAPAAQRVTEGEKATKPTDPAAEGYTFGGWYTEAQCRNAYNFDTKVTTDLTLYAKWTANTPGSGSSGSNKPGSNSSGTNSSAANPSGSSSTSSSSRSSSVTGPKTGDPGRTGLWVVMLLISMAGLCGIAVTYDKSRRKETYLGKAGQDEGGQGHN